MLTRFLYSLLFFYAFAAYASSLSVLSPASDDPQGSNEALDSRSEDSRMPKPVSKSLYHKLVVFAHYSAASKPKHCPKPPYGSTIADRLDVKKTTTQAVLFRNDKMKHIVLAFPGTQGQTDISLDGMDALVPYHSPGVTCKNCHVHQGFLKAWNSIAHKAIKSVSHELHKNPKYAVFVTGHSLGAALASLATATLKGHGIPVKTFTFGQPRTGDPNYADFIDKIMGASKNKAGNMHRVTHKNDGVTQEPSQSAGYRHHRTEYWERNTKSGGQSAKRTVRCFGQESPFCADGTTVGNTTSLGVNAAHRMYSGVNFKHNNICN